jgi:flagellar motor switch/type III secretory pathway protein FliN
LRQKIVLVVATLLNGFIAIGMRSFDSRLTPPFRTRTWGTPIASVFFFCEEEKQMATAAAQAPPNTAGTAQGSPSEREETKWRPLLGLACDLTVDLPLPDFRVADFLQLHPGSVISTRWRLTRDVPLRANGVLIAWVEFERSGTRLALRLTELA